MEDKTPKSKKRDDTGSKGNQAYSASAQKRDGTIGGSGNKGNQAYSAGPKKRDDTGGSKGNQAYPAKGK